MVLEDYDFGQRVMAAAGVDPYSEVCECGHTKSEHEPAATGEAEATSCDAWECYCEGWKHVQSIYPSPLTPTGHAALWDALVAKGYFVRISFRASGGVHSASVYALAGELNFADRTNRFAALRDVVALALGVVRD